MSAPPRTNVDRVPRRPGAGADLVVEQNAPDEQQRYWVEGDAFPRIVLDVPNGQMLAGNGTVAPSALGGGGAGSLLAANNLSDVASAATALANLGGASGLLDSKVLLSPLAGNATGTVPANGWGTFAQTAYNVPYAISAQNNNSSAQNDAFAWALMRPLQAGTYSWRNYYQKFSSRAIVTLQTSPDGTTWTSVAGATVDNYDVASSAWAQATVTGLTIPAGTLFVRILGATKNASSSGFSITTAGMDLARTA